MPWRPKRHEGHDPCRAHAHGGILSGFIWRSRIDSGQAPKENLDAIPDRKARFRGAHIVGWAIEGIAVLLFLGAAVLAAWDGIQNGFGYFRFFARYLVMLYCMELCDILFFDWFLLCHSNFFPHFYPEPKGVVGPHMFGYNKKEHALHVPLYHPLCAAIAGVCMIF